jgi:site-specific DNA recombinase
MRAVIYTRVSMDRANNAKSVTSQEQACREHCAREGWEVVDVFTDNDRSASVYAKKSRPAFEQLMAVLQNYDVLVTWEASRATRDLEVYVALRAACRSSGVQWSYSGKLFDLSRTDDSFSTGLDMLMAERESSQTRDRVSRAVRQQAEAGKPHGRVPFGYMREYDKASGALLRQIAHPDEAPVITEAADRVLSGESCYSIAKDFQTRGMPLMGEKRWAPHRLSRLLRNPTYAGKRVFQGKVIGDASWEALIPAEKWEALQGILLAPDRMRFHGTEPAWLLTGIATCGVCGATVTRGNNRSNDTYSCRQSACVARRIDPVDALVVAAVKARLLADDALESVNQDAGPEAAEAAHEVVELEARLDGFYQQAAEGSLSPQGLARVEGSLMRKLEDARGRLRSLSKPQRMTIDDPRALADGWEDLPLLEQRDVVRTLMKVVILPAGRGKRIFDPATVQIEPLHA